MFLFRVARGDGIVGPDSGGRFPAADEIQQIAGPQRFRRCPNLAQRLPGGAFLIAAIENHELLRIAQMLNLPPQNAHAQRMERGNLRPLLVSFEEDRPPYFDDP